MFKLTKTSSWWVNNSNNIWLCCSVNNWSQNVLSFSNEKFTIIDIIFFNIFPRVFYCIFNNFQAQNFSAMLNKNIFITIFASTKI